MGWTGRNAAHNLNLMTFNGSTKTFGPAQKLTDTTPVGSGPSLAVFNGNLYVSWRGSTNNRLNVARYNPGDPTHLAGKVTLRETSFNAPSIAAFNGRLYLSWQGGDGRLNIISSADATTFNTKVTYSIQVRTSPTLSPQNSHLFVAWEDTSASSHIVFGEYNPSQPTTLSGVITTTSTSVLPVGLEDGPDSCNVCRQVAWRAASDARIRVGIWNSASTIQPITVTSQTTNFGPAISGGLFCWTGTDASQHVNVAFQP